MLIGGDGDVIEKKEHQSELMLGRRYSAFLYRCNDTLVADKGLGLAGDLAGS